MRLRDSDRKKSFCTLVEVEQQIRFDLELNILVPTLKLSLYSAIVRKNKQIKPSWATWPAAVAQGDWGHSEP